MSNLVSARLELEMMMRQVLGLEQRLSELTSQSPDYTDGKLVPVTLAELEVLGSRDVKQSNLRLILSFYLRFLFCWEDI